MKFIFSRLFVPDMTNWRNYIQDVFKMLKPGGYLEIQEVEFPWMAENIMPDPQIEILSAREIAGWMIEYGSEDVDTCTWFSACPPNNC
ncbi:hypothetical protein MMC21_003314 [Puttea exsequens]|nr:hypothetical protein [Puttea exsequens]